VREQPFRGEDGVVRSQFFLAGMEGQIDDSLQEWESIQQFVRVGMALVESSPP